MGGASGPNDPHGWTGQQFPSIPQGPWASSEEVPDPPGYYLGWPLANLAKRILAALIDWGLFIVVAWLALGLVDTTVGLAFGRDAGAIAATIGFFFLYGLSWYNFCTRQHRTGQSWGKQVMGLRLVTLAELRPPSKASLTFRPLWELVEIFLFCGLGLLVPVFSQRRQFITDRLAGTVVLDERRAGVTLPWVLPTDPVVSVEPPQPQGGVPLPPRRRSKWSEQLTERLGRWRHRPGRPTASPPPPSPSPWSSGGAAGGVPPGDLDLPEPEIEDRPAPSSAPPATPSPVEGFDLPDAGERVERPPAGDVVVPPWGRPEPSSLPPLPPSRDAEDEPPPAPAPSPAPARPALPPGVDPHPSAPPRRDPPAPSYLDDAGIIEALRSGDLSTAHARARAAIDAHFDQGEAIDIAQAVAEYRALFKAAGKAIRVNDATIEHWLGLSD